MTDEELAGIWHYANEGHQQAELATAYRVHVPQLLAELAAWRAIGRDLDCGTCTPFDATRRTYILTVHSSTDIQASARALLNNS